MMSLYKEVTCPVVVIHGKKDKLVPFENANFAVKMLTNAEIELVIDDNANHFIPWSHPAMVNRAIMQMVEKVQLEKVVSSEPVD